MNSKAQQLEDSLLVIWNDRNADNRLAAMEKIYAPDIHFYESQEGPAIIGYQAINEVIAGLQSKWPLEFTFQLNRPAKANHQVQQIAWHLGIPGQLPAASGMDIALIEDGKIKSLHLFLEA
ncbi:nuclear transport factor 2 family protein [Paraflavitalea pollutisoli]|uniref:nuclear transport factor 2 family protein n=1 Tax=Paraflavitalea pollutisoli TaxID=3034143 RepID=UPI0023EC6C1B|nr:nuclear transport factor 2 family protein [Paraflavitalea sp. H1-2-19X]